MIILRRNTINKTLFLLSCSHLMYCFSILAQPLPSPSSDQTRFVHLSINENIAANAVECMLQDTKGFLWFGTTRGLVRFDGYSFLAYRNVVGDSNSLLNDHVLSLCEDHDGDLWIGTAGGGLHRLDKGRDIIHKIVPDEKDVGKETGNSIVAMWADRNGVLWLGNDGEGVKRCNLATLTM